MRLSPGSSIGRYRVIAPLGMGGMGEVYRARDLTLSRDVALKVLPESLFPDIARLKRFQQEALAVSALNHPNIVSVFDFAENDGSPYVIYELLAGDTLRTVLKGGPLPLKRCLDLAGQIAAGLAAAHAAGITHRDIKPENLMITPGDRIKIIDFGLARVTAVVAGDEATHSMEMTAPGVVVGTVSYMSPEQVRGAPVDFRSDQFSLGLVLGEMLSGKKTFHRVTTADTLAAILTETASPAAASGVAAPAPVQWLIDRCLAKEPALRYAATSDLYRDLLNLRDRLHESSPPSAPRSQNSRTRVTIAILTVLVTAGLAFYRSVSRRDVFDMGSYRFTPLAMVNGIAAYPAWSPDGKIVAYAGEVHGVLQIMKRSIVSAAPDQLTHETSDCILPIWSADGARIYYIRDRNLWMIGAGGGLPERVHSNVLSASLSPDGRTLALTRADVAGQGGLWVASPPDAAPKRYAAAAFSTKAFINADVHFSPDGTKIGISLITGERSPEFWILPVSHGEPRALHFLSNLAHWHPFSWMPDSRYALVGVRLSMTNRGQLWMVDTVRDRIRPISISVAAPTDPAVSPDGRIVAFTADQSDFDVKELSLDGQSVKTVLATAASEYSPVWDPAGHGFAYVTNRSGLDEIWVYTQGTDRPVVTERDFPAGLTYYLDGPVFSPDGQRIAFTRRVRGGTTSIWIAPAVGGPAVRLAPSEVSQGSPTWSPDGNWIAYLSTLGGKGTLLKARVGGSGGSQVLKENLFTAPAPRWSPHGNWIAYGTAGEFGLLSPDGHTSKALSKETWLSSEWSRDGEVIYGMRRVEGELVLFSIDMRTGVERKLMALGEAESRTTMGKPKFSLAPDGKTLLFSHYKRRGDIWLLEGFQQRLGLLQGQWREHVPD